MPNRLQSGPKVPSKVFLDLTEAYLAKWSNLFPQDHKGRQFELCPPLILPEAGAEVQHPTVGWSKARMGIRLLGRAMLGQTVVVAIIYGFVGTD